MATKVKKESRLEKISKYFLINLLLSFIGWGYETLLMLILAGELQNRGFLSLPLCPIYGCTLMAVYFLLGTPDEGRGLLKRVYDPIKRRLLYLLGAFTAPTVAELIVGAYFDKFHGVWLWSYHGLPLNFRGYVSLPISVLWAVMIFLFMKFIFPVLKRWVFRLPKVLATALAIALLSVLLADLVKCYLAM